MNGSNANIFSRKNQELVRIFDDGKIVILNVALKRIEKRGSMLNTSNLENSSQDKKGRSTWNERTISKIAEKGST